jgi:dTDP-4-amino-4,6-dideoxygalactose transaminase
LYETRVGPTRLTGELSRVQGWLRERFPNHPHSYFGLSGTTLLYEVLKTQTRASVILPAFICANLSAAAVLAEKRVTHIDADRLTLLPDMAQLETHLAGQDASDTIVLIDHSFGYPFPRLDALRRRIPKLLIIEDCARALGVQICGRSPGEYSDWVLLSMYKTTRGNSNGAILLTKTPILIREGQRTLATVRDRVATVAPLRFIYHLLQRTHPDFGPQRSDLIFPEWTPKYGFPSKLCLTRFAAELREFELRASRRCSITEELTDRLSHVAGVDCIKAAEGCQSAGHFISFRVQKRQARDQILMRLHRKGLFLVRTWNIVPAHYRSFSKTFPSGRANSEHLAEHMLHIPVRLFHSSKERHRLVRALCDLAS